jgi:predicted lipid carrier protein YhbT
MLPTEQLHKIYQTLKPVAFFTMRNAPFNAQKNIAEQILNHLLKEAIDDGDLEFLNHKKITIKFLDANVCWNFRFVNNRLIFCNSADIGQVTISGDSDSFLLLAAGQKDPDTLFFRRLLTIEGDTELGLEVKNLLDSLEMDTLPMPLQSLLKEGGKVAEMALHY